MPSQHFKTEPTMNMNNECPPTGSVNNLSRGQSSGGQSSGQQKLVSIIFHTHTMNNHPGADAERICGRTLAEVVAGLNTNGTATLSWFLDASTISRMILSLHAQDITSEDVFYRPDPANRNQRTASWGPNTPLANVIAAAGLLDVLTTAGAIAEVNTLVEAVLALVGQLLAVLQQGAMPVIIQVRGAPENTLRWSAAWAALWRRDQAALETWVDHWVFLVGAEGDDARVVRRPTAEDQAVENEVRLFGQLFCLLRQRSWELLTRLPHMDRRCSKKPSTS